MYIDTSKEWVKQKTTSLIKKGIHISFKATIILSVIGILVITKAHLNLETNRNEHQAFIQQIETNRNEHQAFIQQIERLEQRVADLEMLYKTELVKAEVRKSKEYKQFLTLTKLDDTDTSMKLMKAILKSSNKYDIDWRLLTILIKSESHFKNTKHKHPDVVGIAGINYKVWKKELSKANIAHKKNDLHNIEKAIEASAHILKIYIDRYNGDVKKALHGYKGLGVDKTTGKPGSVYGDKVYLSYLSIL